MESIHKLELLIASWYKGMPHLPKNGQKWLAQNAWWLVLIGVIFGVMGIFFVISVTLLAGMFLAGFGGFAGVAAGGIALLAVLVYLIFSIAEVVLSAMAIAPLKTMRTQGWTLLFMAMLVNVLSLVFSFLFNFNLFSLVWGLIIVAIAMFFLFEVRDYFTASHSNKNKN
jgi:hypothetical protein